jgi:hypothetical protein
MSPGVSNNDSTCRHWRQAVLAQAKVAWGPVSSCHSSLLPSLAGVSLSAGFSQTQTTTPETADGLLCHTSRVRELAAAETSTSRASSGSAQTSQTSAGLQLWPQRLCRKRKRACAGMPLCVLPHCAKLTMTG